MSKVFDKEMVRLRSRHRLAKVSILSDLKQYQYVRESCTSVNRHVWYTVCTPITFPIDTQDLRAMGEDQLQGYDKQGLRFFLLIVSVIKRRTPNNI